MIKIPFVTMPALRRHFSFWGHTYGSRRGDIQGVYRAHWYRLWRTWLSWGLYWDLVSLGTPEVINNGIDE